ncbi:MAG: SDR family NAD(P)-dependent oxidoreductase, partial [Verrucomicrobia bacterium]|nr:SDR family NAD(P)-dependent oxidoreductase [Verrucomicrobiota bacterium]
MISYPDLKNQNVLVTGGANGIGAAMVRAFHQQGSRVFFCDLDARAGRALERSLVVRFVNTLTFVAPNLAWGKARRASIPRQWGCDRGATQPQAKF